MTWLALVAAALGGGILATLLEDALRRRRAYRTALLLVRFEISRNATWIEQGKSPAGQPHKDKMFAPGRIVTGAWEAQKPALAGRFWTKSHSLWAELNASYTTLEAASATATEPPDDIVPYLRSLEDRLGSFDPTWRELCVVYLATHAGTRWLGVALATRVSRRE